MNRDDFDVLREEFFDRIRATNDAKGHDYAGDGDALANFKEAAEHLKDITDPTFAAWYIYFHKHWSAILTFLKEGDVKSEPIDGRIMDAVLYLILLLGLIEDRKAEAIARQRQDELARRTQVFETDRIHVADDVVSAQSGTILHPRRANPWEILQAHRSKILDAEELESIRIELQVNGWRPDRFGIEDTAHGPYMRYFDEDRGDLVEIRVPPR
jgi:hypothetical protein